MLLLSAPLHCLRKTKAFRTLLNSRFNRPALYQLGYNHRVAIRPLTHASILWKRAKLEPGLRTLMNEICRKLNSSSKGSYFLDVGANIGLYTWQVARIAPELKIIAFEPDPNNFELLKMTNEASGLKHVELCPVALSDQSKKGSSTRITLLLRPVVYAWMINHGSNSILMAHPIKFPFKQERWMTY